MATLPSGLRPNATMTNFAISYVASKDIRAQVSPGVVPVKVESDQYRVWNRGQLMRASLQVRRPGQESALLEGQLSNETYFCKRWSGKRKLTDTDIDKYVGGQAEAEREIAGHLTEQVYQTISTQFNTTMFTSGNFTANTAQTGASTASTNQFIQWSRASTIPVKNVATQKRVINAATGFLPTHLICGGKVIDDLANTDDVLDRIRYTRTGVATEELMAGMFGIKEVLGFRAARNTAAEGATDSISVYEDVDAVLAYFSDGQSMNSPAAAKIFAFDKYGIFPRRGTRVMPAPAIFKWWDNATRSWYYEAEIHFDVKVTADEAAVYFITAVQA